MPRTIGSVEPLQSAALYDPYLKVTKQDELWRLTQQSVETTSVHPDIPAVAGVTANGVAVVAGHSTDGYVRIASGTPTSPSAWAYGQSGWTLPYSSFGRPRGSMNGAVMYTARYPAIPGYPKLCSIDLGGANTLIDSVDIPFTCDDTWYSSGGVVVSPSCFTRVDAVCYTTAGIVVACSSHRWDVPFVTLSFYVVNGTTVTPLRTIFQVPNTATGSTWNHFDYNTWTFRTQAIEGAGGILIYAQLPDRVVEFVYRNGIESEPRDVIPVDEYGGTYTFFINSVNQIGSLFHMSGRHDRTMSDTETIHLEVCLTSDSGWNWSVGDMNFLIAQPGTPQNLVMPRDARSTVPNVIFGGHGGLYTGATRPLDGNGSETDLTNDVLAWSMQSAANSADAHDLALANAQGGYNALPETTVFTVEAGYYDAAKAAVKTQIGRFMIDAESSAFDVHGQAPISIPGVDVGQGRLAQWHCPIDVDRWSSTFHTDALQTLGQIVAKTALVDAKADSAGLHSFALNHPLIAYATAQTYGNGITRLRFRYVANQADTYCLPYVGIVFGGTDDAKFNVVIFPHTGQSSHWAKTGAEFRQSALPAPDATDPSLGGFNLTTGLAPALVSKVFHPLTSYGGGGSNDAVSSMVPITSQVGSALTATFATNVFYDVAVRRWGNRIQVYRKTVDYTPANCAANATLQGIGTFSLTDMVVGKRGTGRESVGLMVGTDVMAFDNCPAGLTASGIEPVLTYAKDGDNDAAWEWGSAYSRNPSDNSYQTQSALYSAIQYGRGIFISEDNTRVSVREVVRSSGQNFDLFCQKHWDYYDTPGSIYNPKTTPRDWRVLFEPAGIAFRTVADDGFDTSNLALRNTFGIARVGCIRVGNEIIKYFQLPGSGIQNSLGTYIDRELWATHELLTQMHNWPDRLYADTLLVHQRWCLPALGSDMTVLTNWESGGARPGDNFGIHNTDYNCIDDPSFLVGMQVKLHGRASRVEDNTDPIYVIGQDTNGSVDGGAATISRPVTVLAGGTEGASSVVAEITGRGFYKTADMIHDTSEPTVYYPRYAPQKGDGSWQDEPPLNNIVQVRRFDHFSGLYNYAESHLKYLCTLAGVMGTTFRNWHSRTGTINPTPTFLTDGFDNVIELSDFVLEITGPLPHAPDYLIVNFRQQGAGAAYTLRIWCGTGSETTVAIALDAPNSEIVPNVNGLKKLEEVYVDAFTTAPTGTPLTRLIVKGPRITVEIASQHVWTFNLDATGYWTGTEAKNWRIDTAGPVSVGTGSGSYTMTTRIPELHDEVENQVIDGGQTGGQAVSFVTDERHILMRSSPTGSIEFGRHHYRGNGGTIPVGVQDVSKVKMNGVAAHVQVSGAEYGEAVDMAFIRDHGYSYSTASNRLAGSVGDSVTEAKYLIRLSKEYAEQREVECAGMPAVQPEDKVTHPRNSQVYVVTQAALQIDSATRRFASRLGLRKYIQEL